MLSYLSLLLASLVLPQDLQSEYANFIDLHSAGDGLSKTQPIALLGLQYRAAEASVSCRLWRCSARRPKPKTSLKQVSVCRCIYIYIHIYICIDWESH